VSKIVDDVSVGKDYRACDAVAMTDFSAFASPTRPERRLLHGVLPVPCLEKPVVNRAAWIKEPANSQDSEGPKGTDTLGTRMTLCAYSAMAKTYAGGTNLVRVTTDDREHQLWVAATPRAEAVTCVLNAVPEGWTAALLTNRLTRQEVEALKLRPGEVREITSLTG